MTTKSPPKFAHLGQPSTIPAEPDAKTLDRAPNPHSDTDFVTRFAAPEFTSICPMTGQPDFAHLVIDYAPDKPPMLHFFAAWGGGFARLPDGSSAANAGVATINAATSAAVARLRVMGSLIALWTARRNATLATQVAIRKE